MLCCSMSWTIWFSLISGLRATANGSKKRNHADGVAFFMPERAGHCDAPAAASENDLHQKVRKISKKTGKMVKKVREMAKNT